VNLKPRCLAGLSQCLDEVLPIDIVQEDVLTPITPAQDVVDGTQLLDSHFARHAPELLSQA